MIIDGHAHACGDYLKPEEIKKNLDSNDTSKVVLAPGELGSTRTYPFPNVSRLFPDRNIVKVFNQLTKMVVRITNMRLEFEKGNEYVHDLVKKLPDRVIQFYLLTDESENIYEELEKKYDDWKFRGLKLHQCWYPISIDSDYFNIAAKWAEERKIPIFIHLVSDKEVTKLIDYKRKRKDLKVIIGHLFGLELFMKQSENLEKIYYDISTYQVTSDKRVLKAIKRFGAERITMGSDTPYGKNNLKRNIERVERLPIRQDEKNMILGLNMKGLLGI